MTNPELLPCAPRRLVEPLGLLHGPEADAAVAAGIALPLGGGPAAFTACALIDGLERTLLPVGAVPDGWRDVLRAVVEPPPSAGLPPGPLVMGILNVTPDSFSDGGRHADPAIAVAAARRMAADGADLVDIGGESTRPGSAVVPPEEEQRRVLPVVCALAGSGPLLSVDTRNASTMRAVLDAGADVVNDVAALAHDPEAASVVAASRKPVVLMHMRGTPQTMGDHAHYRDVAVEVVRELAARIDGAVRAGIRRERIVVDPGIGFAKTEAHNLELLRRLPLLLNLRCRILLGVSRKGFIGRIGGAPVATDRLPGSLAAVVGAAPTLPGIILRVHDVPETRQALRVALAVAGHAP
jgi:dihydropteroate synthase